MKLMKLTIIYFKKTGFVADQLYEISVFTSHMQHVFTQSSENKILFTTVQKVAVLSLQNSLV